MQTNHNHREYHHTWFARSRLCLSSSHGLEKSRLCLPQFKLFFLHFIKSYTEGTVLTFRFVIVYKVLQIRFKPSKTSAGQRKGDWVRVDDVLKVVLHKLGTNLRQKDQVLSSPRLKAFTSDRRSPPTLPSMAARSRENAPKTKRPSMRCI